MAGQSTLLWFVATHAEITRFWVVSRLSVLGTMSYNSSILETAMIVLRMDRGAPAINGPPRTTSPLLLV